MASAGLDWATDPYTRIIWGIGYIKATYGTPEMAWAHERLWVVLTIRRAEFRGARGNQPAVRNDHGAFLLAGRGNGRLP
jgi:hypothetical protein